jgi:EAL domain-containing protein (putative c-di-GMP-specific phosphodiesterase class I)
MAHSLRLNVVAEGVEHRNQLEQLGLEGCDEFQGYFCRPPLDEPELMRFLAEERAGRDAAAKLPPSPQHLTRRA